MNSKNNLFSVKNLKNDFPASIVVFLVALPLCLGISLASGAPPLAGVIAGIIGGIVVGSLSGSSLGVSGPAAGLAVIVLNAITDLGSFETFLVAVIIAGGIQVLLGFLKAGVIAYYFPSSVIHGMLAGIGIIIFFKQIPHAFGYDKDPEGELDFAQLDHENTFSELWNMIDFMSPGAVIITLVSLFILILWESKFIKSKKFSTLLPGPLLAVVSGILLTKIFEGNLALTISKEHLVSLPVSTSASDFLNNFSTPNFNAFANKQVYITAIIIAVVGSLETLLSVEATDKLDPYKRITPTNRELKAQGVGNIISGFIGGLPITQVIVRSSANQQSGGKSKLSTIIHGALLLISIVLIPSVLNLIPFATLAAILMVIGYKLAKPSLFKKIYKQGLEQFLPFIVTILGMIFSDLLIGISLGIVVAILVILRNNFRIPFEVQSSVKDGNKQIKVLLSEDVTFLNKASIIKLLKQIPDGSMVEINATNTQFIHHDVMEILEDFEINAKSRNIELSLIDVLTEKEKKTIQHIEINKTL